MKVIGTTEVQQSQYHKQDAYVVVITHAELQKVADKAGYGIEFPKLKVGEDYPIDQGHDFRREITSAVQKMSEAYAAFAKVAPVAAEFAGVVQRKATGEQA